MDNIAFHESTHAVICAKLGILGTESKITINRERHVYGSVEFSRDGSDDAWKQWPEDYTRNAIVAYLAGPLASLELDPNLDIFQEGGLYELDMHLARVMATWIGDEFFTLNADNPDPTWIKQSTFWKTARVLVRRHRKAIDRVANELLKHRDLTGLKVLEIVL